jgi:uncharacterized membrane protein
MLWFRRRRPAVPAVIQKNIRSITQLEEAFAQQRSRLDRISDAISAFAGSIQFILAHVVIFVAWMVLNTPWVLGTRSFDPYPYIFMNFVLAVEAVFLGTFVLMSQNRQSRQAEQRARLDLQIGLLAEQETTKTLQMLQRICERLGLNDVSKDRELQQMIETTHIEEVARGIQQARTEETAGPPAVRTE